MCVCLRVCVCACVRQTYPPLQAIPLPQCQCISLGNNWDNVDFAVDGLHKLYIQRLKTSKEKEKRNNYNNVEEEINGKNNNTE